MNAAEKSRLYANLCEKFADWVFTLDHPEKFSDKWWTETAEFIGCSVSTAQKVYDADTKGMKLSYEQVVSIASLMGIPPAELLEAPKDVDETFIQAISSLYEGLSTKGIEATLRKVVEGLAEWFDLSVAQVYDKLFEMMENKKLIVDDGLFCEPGES